MGWILACMASDEPCVMKLTPTTPTTVYLLKHGGHSVLSLTAVLFYILMYMTGPLYFATHFQHPNSMAPECDQCDLKTLPYKGMELQGFSTIAN